MSMKLYRKYHFVLFADSPAYDMDKVVTALFKDCEDYFLATHCYKEVSGKKEHKHMIVLMPKACTITQMSERYGVPVHFIDRVKDWDATVGYLKAGV